ncbi:hypothetical protein PsorP6_014542 [Peronosclerospora sorghi]|uniref:Uncharacterized protein n=1 Tax=Peronosclerospora sorghi TaxID=230839 RepID=A0ACC0VT53_9STRA|nr:hypothetical protein PsorP6_014542 [Peronosclerospora sorghi]
MTRSYRQRLRRLHRRLNAEQSATQSPIQQSEALSTREARISEHEIDETHDRADDVTTPELSLATQLLLYLYKGGNTNRSPSDRETVVYFSDDEEYTDYLACKTLAAFQKSAVATLGLSQIISVKIINNSLDVHDPAVDPGDGSKRSDVQDEEINYWFKISVVRQSELNLDHSPSAPSPQIIISKRDQAFPESEFATLVPWTSRQICTLRLVHLTEQILASFLSQPDFWNSPRLCPSRSSDPIYSPDRRLLM